jgi:hypothetical protein
MGDAPALFRFPEPLVNFINGRDFKENVSKSWVKWVQNVIVLTSHYD